MQNELKELTEKLEQKTTECNNWSKMHGELLELSVSQKTTIDELEKENRHLAYQTSVYLEEMNKLKELLAENEKELSGAIELINNIANPIIYLENEAKKEGGKLNGMAAMEYIKNGNNFIEMAKQFIAK